MAEVSAVARWFGDADAFERADRLWAPVSDASLGVARPLAGERVLDACCGSGAFAVPAAQAVGDSGDVLAVDLSHALVRRVRERAAQEGLTWLRSVQGDVTTAGEPSTFDLVSCILGVFLFADMDSGGEHLVSRARPGGRVCVTTWAQGALHPLMRLLVQAAALHRPELLFPGESPGRHDPSERVQTEQGLRQYLLGIGLQDVEVDRVPLTVPLDGQLAVALLDGSAGMALVDGLAPGKIGQVRDDVLTRADRLGGTLDASVLVGLGRRR